MRSAESSARVPDVRDRIVAPCHARTVFRATRMDRIEQTKRLERERNPATTPLAARQSAPHAPCGDDGGNGGHIVERLILLERLTHERCVSSREKRANRSRVFSGASCACGDADACGDSPLDCERRVRPSLALPPIATIRSIARRARAAIAGGHGDAMLQMLERAQHLRQAS